MQDLIFWATKENKIFEGFNRLLFSATKGAVTPDKDTVICVS